MALYAGVEVHVVMTDIRIENEVKLLSPGGPFAFTGTDAARAVGFLMNTVAACSMTASEPRFINLHDEYYMDSEGKMESTGSILRYRIADGWKHSITIKQPYLRTGLGLSRRQIETELFITASFDKHLALEDLAGRYLGTSRIDADPLVVDDILRIRMDIRSEVRPYTLSFDRITYSDARTHKYTAPGYELELESIDSPIKDDPVIQRFINVLIDTGGFKEERISKFARGKAWVEKLAGL